MAPEGLQILLPLLRDLHPPQLLMARVLQDLDMSKGGGDSEPIVQDLLEVCGTGNSLGLLPAYTLVRILVGTTRAACSQRMAARHCTAPTLSLGRPCAAGRSREMFSAENRAVPEIESRSTDRPEARSASPFIVKRGESASLLKF